MLSVREPDLWQKAQRRLTGDWTSASLDADRYFSSSSAWRGFISYRSPWNSTRLVVVALASNDDQLARLKRSGLTAHQCRDPWRYRGDHQR
ncbi:cellulose biosynthesis cyclic di-GMP-binding regulatory protein BcsB [Klebsiella pneumoniae]|uniref:cellulose biosynthesis cyclic di-GMP-binding regulatory protein BcsB n=1 Tax=Klebsiella pneumoniae TaxID=573 RepID=UPI003970AC98